MKLDKVTTLDFVPKVTFRFWNRLGEKDRNP